MVKFLVSEIPVYVAAISVLIALLGGFVIGYVNNEEIKFKRKLKKEDKKWKRKLVEDIGDKVCDEVNSQTRLYLLQTGYMFYPGIVRRERLFLRFDVTYKSKSAFVKFYLRTKDNQSYKHMPPVVEEIFLETLDEDLSDYYVKTAVKRVTKSLKRYS